MSKQRQLAPKGKRFRESAPELTEGESFAGWVFQAASTTQYTPIKAQRVRGSTIRFATNVTADESLSYGDWFSARWDAGFAEVERISGFGQRSTVIVPLTTLAPENIKVLKPIPVVICREDEDFSAAFYDAGIHASGDTEQDAFNSLREILIADFELFDSEDPSRLGPGPRLQLAVLREYIARA